MSSLVLLIFILVSGRRLHLDSESMKVKTAVTRGMVTSTWADEGVVRERTTCFSRSAGSKGPLVGRSLGWSVTYSSFTLV